jgi:hypothetical protein
VDLASGDYFARQFSPLLGCVTSTRTFYGTLGI